MIWAVSLDRHCIGNNRMYLWYEPPIFMGFGNNMYKGEVLAIEDCDLLCLSGKELSSDCCFEVDRIVI